MLFLLMLLGCSAQVETDGPEDAVAEDPNAPTQESWDVVYYVGEQGRERVRLSAGYVAHYEQNDSTHVVFRGAKDEIGTVTAQIYDTDGKPSATLTAQTLYYFDQEQRFEAQGNVEVLGQEGRRLSSQQLEWDEEARRITTEGFVRLQTDVDILEGYALDADEDLLNYTIHRVTGRVVREDNG